MRIKFYFLLILILHLISCKNEEVVPNKDNYIIDLSISNLKNNTELILRKQEGYLSEDLDSTKLINGKAIFKGYIASPEVYGIFIKDYKQAIFPIIEKGTIHITANANDIQRVKISGTPLNNQLAAYKEEIAKISLKMNDLFYEFQKARAENNSKKLAAINHSMRVINDQKNNYSINFIKNNNTSFVASMILHTLVMNTDIPKDTLTSLYNSLSNDVKKSEFSKSIILELNLKKNDTIQKSGALH